ncbi:transmembrane protein, putative [Medicago truncatula]|uniref:Transmembrane protein, putative n=1 Tax=Medicago truncatula TaxID=3880 RepID=A0A072VHB7_MEDTR|nr:transmembrane protein, putative [Medicago truncatula]
MGTDNAEFGQKIVQGMARLLNIVKFVLLFFPIIFYHNGEFYNAEHVENYLHCNGHVENRDDGNEDENDDNVDDPVGLAPLMEDV